jgi:hypothetical protein
MGDGVPTTLAQVWDRPVGQKRGPRDCEPLVWRGSGLTAVTGNPSPERRHPVSPAPGPCGAGGGHISGRSSADLAPALASALRSTSAALPLWRPARRRRAHRGWRRCGAAPWVRSPGSRPPGSAGCRVRAGTRCLASHPPRPGAIRGRPAGSGGGLVSAWASAGSTVTIAGTTNAPVPTTAAFRMKSRRSRPRAVNVKRHEATTTRTMHVPPASGCARHPWGVGSPTAVGVCGYLTAMVRPRRTQEVT